MNTYMVRPGQVVGLCAMMLLCIGVVMVNSVDMKVTPVDGENVVAGSLSLSDIVTSRAAIYAGLAMAALIIGYFMPVRRIAELINQRFNERGGTFWPAFATAVILLLAFCALTYVPGIADPRNGARRWIKLGSRELSMQPSEVAKWALIPLLAWYCAVRGPAIRKFFTGLVPAFVTIGAVAGFVLIEDLGTGVLIGAVACLVLLCGGARFWHFGVPGAIAAAGIVAAIWTSVYRQNRVKAFLNPYDNPETIGFHTIQGLVAIHNGKGFGMGLGEGIQKMGYLPERRTDYIFAVICEETGIAGAAVIVAVFTGVLWAGLSVAKREHNVMLKLWALGITATIALQAMMNLFVVTGMAPAKGIALPLVSYGGTGWIMTALSVGILMSIDAGQRQEEHAGEFSPVTA